MSGRLHNLAVSLLFFAMLAVPAREAAANEDSARQTNDGILLLDQTKTQEALAKFKSAVSADTADEDARYYLAHTEILLGMYGDAIQVLSGARFEFWDADFLRGISYMNLNSLDAAIKAFEKSAAAGKSPRAKYYLGVLRYQKGNYQGAHDALRDAGRQDEEVEPFRQLYLGLSAGALGKSSLAKRYFDTLERTAPDSPAAEMANELQDKRRSGNKHVFFDGRLAEQFDSNPALVQSDARLAGVYHPNLTQAASALRTSVFTALRFTAGREAGFHWKLNASSYESVHAGNKNVNQFNALQPDVSTAFAYGTATWSVELPVDVSPTWLGFAATTMTWYNTIINVGGSYRHNLNKVLSLRGGVQWQNQDFGAAAADRNGMDIAVPLEVTYQPIKAVRAIGGYTFDDYITNKSASEWKFLGNRIHAGATYRPVGLLTLFAQLAYANRAYANRFLDTATGTAQKRGDNELDAGIGLRLSPSDRFDLTVGYDGTFQSSIPAFTYNRHVVTASVGLSL